MYEPAVVKPGVLCAAYLSSLLVAAACGGKSKGASPPPPGPPVEEEVAAEPEPAPEPEPPPPPQQWSATATLTPVKGAAVKVAVVRFSQTEGEGTAVATTAPLAGLKAGTYRLVIHESAECGKNATKVGPVWAEVADVAFEIVVAKGAAGELDQSDVAITLDGDGAIVGRTLVLHAVTKGKLGKVLACGSIAADEAPADDLADGDD